MGQKSKKGKGRLDKFYYLAKEQGFRSRAAFKLIQLNKKFNFLSSARSVLDLCAAPGGWLQVAAKYTPVGSLIIGVDLDPIKPIKNVTTFQEDITSAKCRSEINRLVQGSKVDVVLHDGAPNVGTNWNQDAYSQSELVLCSLKLATEFLGKGGNFITKVFRSSDYNSLLWVFNQLFKKVDATKPQASRNTSAEIFVVCSGYYAPQKIDPRLLDPKHVFKEIETAAAPASIWKEKKRPSRTGYDDGKMLLFNKMSVADFIESPDAITLLATQNQLEFDERSAVYKSRPETNSEILALCADLKVLGKTDFKRLLKWRSSMQKFKPDQHEEEESEEEETPVPMTAEEEEEALTNELEEKLSSLSEKQQKEIRKKAKEKRKKVEKLKIRAAQATSVDMQEDKTLFALSSIKNDTNLKAIASANVADIIIEEKTKAPKPPKFIKLPANEDEDGQEAYKRYVEEQMDGLYEMYLEKHGSKNKLKKLRKRQGKEEDNEDLHDTVENKQINDSDEEDDPDVANSLVVKDDIVKEKAAVRAERWFGQDIFAGIQDEDEETIAIQQMKAKFAKQTETKEKMQRKLEDEPLTKRQKKDEEEKFEEAPLQKYESGSESDLDDDEKVSGLALATMIVKNPKLKQDLIDNSYNRYTFNDPNLPQWFEDEETEHNQPHLNLSKTVVDDIKDKIKALNARPIKKVAEAKARKKMHAAKRLEKIKNQAESIAEANDMAPGEKSKAIEKLYKKSKKGLKRKTVLIVNQKGGGRVAKGMTKTKGAKIKLVDSRMRKDLRAQKAIQKKDKSGKRKKR